VPVGATLPGEIISLTPLVTSRKGILTCNSSSDKRSRGVRCDIFERGNISDSRYHRRRITLNRHCSGLYHVDVDYVVLVAYVEMLLAANLAPPSGSNLCLRVSRDLDYHSILSVAGRAVYDTQHFTLTTALHAINQILSEIYLPQRKTSEQDVVRNVTRIHVRPCSRVEGEHRQCTSRHRFRL